MELSYLSLVSFLFKKNDELENLAVCPWHSQNEKDKYSFFLFNLKISLGAELQLITPDFSSSFLELEQVLIFKLS